MAPSTRFDRDGYVVVPNVLSPAEIAGLRARLDAELDREGVSFGLGTVVPAAAAVSPALADVYAHPIVVDAVRTALDDDIVFTMESGLHRNVTGPWHKDLGTHVVDGGYYGTPDVHDRTDCRVVKVGIYLQDQRGERCLDVRAGSHRTARLDTGPIVPLETRAGEIVVFDARITHRGQPPDRVDRVIADAARLAPREARGATIARARRRANRLRGRSDRLAVFIAFGPDNAMTATYARRNLDRELAQSHHADAHLSEDLLDRFAQLGVGVTPTTERSSA